MISGFLAKNKTFRRLRLACRAMFDHPAKKVGHPRTSYKVAKKYSKRNAVSDAMFCDDASYIPFRYIKGTIHVPGTDAKGYVDQ